MEAAVTSLSNKANSIQWKQLWSLSALYASIVIGWIAYQNYQPKLLEKFNFTDFTFFLIVVQGIILVVTPPIAGRLGDRFRVQRGHRLPIITLGISFAAMVFMAVAFTLFTNPGEVFRWVLPLLIVFWLVAMSIFTSPALSTIELFSPSEQLPRAMAILTIVANLLYALEPVIVDIIDYLGAPLTFMSGGLVVLISGYALRNNSISLFQHKKEFVMSQKEDVLKSDYSFIFFLGIGLGLATTLLFNIFPAIFSEKLFPILNGLDGKWVVVAVLVLSALLSLPLSNVVNKEGLQRSFRWSFIAILLSMLTILFLSNVIAVLIMTIIFAITFTVLSVSSLPWAINLSRSDEKVFCVGIFFSGVALPDGIVQAVLSF
jgi:MFS family permease